MGYRAEIDGLRAVAVVPVILFHAGLETFSGGFVGVDVFFVISGYLITTLLINEMDEGTYSLAGFYERRARRILPALFLVTLCTVPFAFIWLVPPLELKAYAHSLMAVSTFSSNILFWRESGYFDTASELKPLLHTWSLAVEEQFYIVFPLLLAAMWRFGRRATIWMLAVIFVMSLAMSHWGAYYKPNPTFYLLPTRGWELLVGTFTAFYLQRNVRETGATASNILSLLGLALVLFSIFYYDKSTPFPSLYSLAPTLGTALIILFATQGTAVHALLKAKIFVGIGLVSYSAYLWHQPILVFMKYQYTELSPGLLITFIIGTFILAYLSWRFVETPARRSSDSRKAIFIKSAVFSTGIFAIGLIIHLNEGNFGRFDPQVVEILNQRSAHESYTFLLKDRTHLRPFSTSGKRKVLIIGDSNSGDMENALSLAFGDRFEFSSANIPVGCGNVFVDQNRISRLRTGNEIKTCPVFENYATPNLQDLIRSADLVVVASSWRMWEADLMRESVTNLEEKYGAKFVFIGTKSIIYDEMKLLKTGIGAFRNMTAPANPKGQMINAALKATLGPRFIDPYSLMCKEDECPLVNESGKPVYYDSSHFTRFGAEEFAQKLLTLKAFN